MSTTFEFLVFSLGPAVVLMALVYRQDKVEKEPLNYLFRLILAGVLSGILTIFLGQLPELIVSSFKSINDPSYPIYRAFFAVALVEEGTKFYLLKKASWHNLEFNYRFDGIVYAVAVSLGFASLENVLYIYQFGLGIALGRALMSIPGHLCFGILMGFYYGLAKFRERRGLSYRYALGLSVLVPIFLHGFYDAILMLNQQSLMPIFYGFIVLLFSGSYFLLKYESKHDQRISY